MKPPIEYGRYYHIYNRGNNYENIFSDDKDYLHFLKIYEIYIHSIADTFAWCMMKNHFHLLVRIKEEHEIGFLNSGHAQSEETALKWETYFPEEPDEKFSKKPVPTQQFKHLFNAYSRWFNIKHKRRGSLFEKNFERKLIDNDTYLANLIVYIHNNPVKHGFVDHAMEYPWSSYQIIVSEKPTNLKRQEVVNYFDDLENLKYQHDFMADKLEGGIGQLIIE